MEQERQRRNSKRLLVTVALWTITFGCWIQSNRLTVLMKSSSPQDSQDRDGKGTVGERNLSARPKQIPLEELVDTQVETVCPPGLVLLQDVRHANTSNTVVPRKIPRIIHVTAKSRCVTPRVAQVLDTWKTYSDHQFYFHNDAALHRLIFEKEWPEFPQLRIALDCSNSMVEQADLWRALVLWEYGGIYTDIDNTPKNFNVSSTLKTDDEAYFEVEQGRWLSQYFFAAEPRHPLMYLLIMQVWGRLFTLPNVHDQYAPFISGPGALKNAMKHFMGTHQMAVDSKGPCVVFEKVCAGHYVGLGNRTVTVAPRTWAVNRAVIKKKGNVYNAMNMSHFNSVRRRQSTESCLNRLYTLQRPLWENGEHNMSTV